MILYAHREGRKTTCLIFKIIKYNLDLNVNLLYVPGIFPDSFSMSSFPHLHFSCFPSPQPLNSFYFSVLFLLLSVGEKQTGLEWESRGSAMLNPAFALSEGEEPLHTCHLLPALGLECFLGNPSAGSLPHQEHEI